MERTKSFWIDNLSFLDRMFFKMRCKKVLKGIDLDNKIVVDTWCWYSALTLQYIHKNHSPKKLIAVDLQLNKSYLAKLKIDALESDLNTSWSLPQKADVIISTAILEHLNNPDEYLKNVYKNLSNDWILVMTIPSVYSKPVLEFLAYKFKIISKEEILDHKQYYDKSKLLSKLQRAWFKKHNIHHQYFQFFMNNYVKAIKW